MNSKIVILKTSLILLCSSLVACGGSGESSTPSTPEVVVPPQPVTEVESTDMRMTAMAEHENRLDLSTFVNKQSDDSLYVADVKALSEQSQCQRFSFDQQVMRISPEHVGSCVYEYRVQSASNEQMYAVSTMQLGILADEHSFAQTAAGTIDVLELPPLSAVIQQGDADLTLDLKAELAASWPGDEYTISDTPTLVGAGSGETFSYDSVANTVTLDSNRELGNSRLYYSLGNGTNEYLGVIDVAVATQVNHGVVVPNFEYMYDVIEQQAVVIDLTAVMSDSDSSDTLEITEVDAFNAQTAIESATTFSFEAPMPGLYNVSYLATDNNGDFVMGGMVITVVSPFANIDLLESADVVAQEFKAPFTLEEATLRGLYFATPYTDPAHTSPIPTYDYYTADAVCVAYGGRLPYLSELQDLYDQQGNLYDSDGWPVERPYISADTFEETDGSLYADALDFKTGQVQRLSLGDADTPPQTGYLSCVENKIARVEIISPSTYVSMTTDGQARAFVSASLTGEVDSAPIEPLIWSSSDSDVFWVSQGGYFQANREGQATLSVSNQDGTVTDSQSITVVENLVLSAGADSTFDALDPGTMVCEEEPFGSSGTVKAGWKGVNSYQSSDTQLKIVKNCSASRGGSPQGGGYAYFDALFQENSRTYPAIIAQDKVTLSAGTYKLLLLIQKPLIQGYYNPITVPPNLGVCYRDASSTRRCKYTNLFTKYGEVDTAAGVTIEKTFSNRWLLLSLSHTQTSTRDNEIEIGLGMTDSTFTLDTTYKFGVDDVFFIRQ